MQLGNFQEPNPIHEGDRLLKKVKRLIAKARTTQTPIIYVQNNGGEGDPDERGTPGWEIHPSIEPEQGDIVV
jgi:nicotinamidase-related amidase